VLILLAMPGLQVPELLRSLEEEERARRSHHLHGTTARRAHRRALWRELFFGSLRSHDGKRATDFLVAEDACAARFRKSAGTHPAC